MNFSGIIKHTLHCITLFSVILLVQIEGVFNHKNTDTRQTTGSSWIETILIFIIYLLRSLVLLTIPQTLANLIGLVRFNTFPEDVILKNLPLLKFPICFRIVTKGDYPDLVKKNVNTIIEVCKNVELQDYSIEVVTDKTIKSRGDINNFREIVVSEDYETSTKALFKAKALQYCFEKNVNTLSDNDWIVHLDEETRLTENSLKGIINFINDGKYHIGQGLITYANEEIKNCVTTLADCIRVADDMGKLRCQFKIFHKPFFSFKGSYIVCQVKIEKQISYDNGPEGSIAEDCYFAIKAFSHGYTFDFIEGEMWEKSPFTIRDYLQQRKRWLHGILLVVHSQKISIRYKLLLAMSCYGWATLPLQLSNYVIHFFHPVSILPCLDFTIRLSAAVNIYMFLFGALKSFNARTLGIRIYLLYLIGSVAMIPIFLLIELSAVCCAWIKYFSSSKPDFKVIKK